jgi:hypothetical protein
MNYRLTTLQAHKGITMKDDITKTKEIITSEVQADSRLTIHHSLPRRRRGVNSFRDDRPIHAEGVVDAWEASKGGNRVSGLKKDKLKSNVSGVADVNSFREGVFTGDSAAAPRRGGGAPFQKARPAQDSCQSDHTFPEKVWMIFSNATMMKANEYEETWSWQIN